MSEDLLPDAVVTAFIEAMHRWEVDAWAASRGARGTPQAEDYLVEVAAACDSVFTRFCTPRKRPHGRNASFSRPPEYNPASERIVEIRVNGDQAEVDTLRDAVLGGAFRYRLRRQGGQWRIDSLKHERDGAWIAAIL
jgi:NTF2 fold immunity protein